MCFSVLTTEWLSALNAKCFGSSFGECLTILSFQCQLSMYTVKISSSSKIYPKNVLGFSRIQPGHFWRVLPSIRKKLRVFTQFEIWWCRKLEVTFPSNWPHVPRILKLSWINIHSFFCLSIAKCISPFFWPSFSESVWLTASIPGVHDASIMQKCSANVVHDLYWSRTATRFRQRPQTSPQMQSANSLGSVSNIYKIQWFSKFHLPYSSECKIQNQIVLRPPMEAKKKLTQSSNLKLKFNPDVGESKKPEFSRIRRWYRRNYEFHYPPHCLPVILAAQVILLVG